MGKSVHDDVLDAALDYIANNCNAMYLCSSEPTTYAEATSTYALADVAIDNTDFTKANGDTSGRKTTVAAQNSVPVDSSGTSTHVAIVDSDNSKLLYVTTHTSQAVTSGNSANIGAWDIEILDPA